ncbi:MAG: tetratricopeptide repeat protein [Hyphomicrobiales bacterium]|nr:tetratricopeptide repeat protein [Hyphomicrobiales bacterium]MBV8825331.1 tetratricopeptide repeat protein [Hyphomicrobiales bacterium]MBV9429034.1 tetratricopeptide repeat protein [Bradyrhizobiaceae bacterium]
MSDDRALRAFHNARLKKLQKQGYDVGAAFARAHALHQSGLASEAQAACRDILRKVPRHFQALQLLAITEYQHGRYEEADRLLRQALTVEPNSVAALTNRGVVLHELKRFAEALACYDKAVAIQPDCAEAISNGANALAQLERFDEAVTRYDRALAVRPAYPEALSNRANALFHLRRYDEALASCDEALALKPNDADALSNRGNTLTHLRRFDKALASLDKALALNPGLSTAWMGRGNVLIRLNRHGEALIAYQNALAAKPDNVNAMVQLAQFHERHGEIDQALSWYDWALALKPDFADAISNRIFTLDFANDVGVEEQQAARKYWWQHIGAKIAGKSRFRYDIDPDPARRIVLGYVSADFRRHSAAATFRPVLQHHDKTQFKIVCYSCSIAQDEKTEEFRRIADRWVDAGQLSDQTLAERIVADKIDILIDLSGHSEGNRLGTFARKPAPVQVTAWGHGTGTGLPTIDYLFCDPVTMPVSVRGFFAEKLYDLPCIITTEPPPPGLRPADPPVLANGHVTFGVFNRMSKVSDEALAVWTDILNRVPGARLLMKDGSLDDESVRAGLKQRFAAHGLAPDRVDFLGYTPREQHLAAFAKVDICLDPFPQNGGVSTWDALHMGVPVVAKLGQVPVSRLSGAILSSLGLHDWVAASATEYADIAVAGASMPEHLRQLRHALPTTIANSASGNGERYTRAVEQAYRSMWQGYCRTRI